MRQLFLTCLVVLALAAGCGRPKTGAENAASLEELNRALTVVAMRSGSFPPSTNELAAFLAISGKTLPVAPPGKKLVIDPSKRQFILADE
ncbi:MAG: hypothetical protein IH623_14245 [Verrucomicrobia bacterium]|nr:hypothetical protein [Verrucomicrobiota bacterium]